MDPKSARGRKEQQDDRGEKNPVNGTAQGNKRNEKKKRQR